MLRRARALDAQRILMVPAAGKSRGPAAKPAPACASPRQRSLARPPSPWHPLATAHDLLLATNGLIPYSLSPRELGDRDAVEQRIQRLARLLLDGVRRRPAARSTRSTPREAA